MEYETLSKVTNHLVNFCKMLNFKYSALILVYKVKQLV